MDDQWKKTNQYTDVENELKERKSNQSTFNWHKQPRINLIQCAYSSNSKGKIYYFKYVYEQFV